MSKLISHRTTETLPSGMTITTLHLTEEAKRGLSTNGATIPPPPGEPHDPLDRFDRTTEAIWVYGGATMGAGLLGLFAGGHWGAIAGLAIFANLCAVSRLMRRSRR